MNSVEKLFFRLMTEWIQLNTMVMTFTEAEELAKQLLRRFENADIKLNVQYKTSTEQPTEAWHAHRCSNDILRPYPTLLCSAGCTRGKSNKEIEEMHLSLREVCNIVNEDTLKKLKENS